MTTVDARRSEWPFVRGGLLVTAAIGVAWIAGWGVYELVHDEPTRLELTTRCLTMEKFVPVSPVTNDPIAQSAGGGALATRIEGNGVVLAIAGSGGEAERIVENYHSVAGPLTGRLEQRGRYVYLWEGVASPTQRQAMFDCEY